MKNRGGLFAGISLLSAAVLALEVYLTRVYSLMVWPYMAFVVVSAALSGGGAAGAASSVAGRRARRQPAATRAARALGFGVTVLIGPAAAVLPAATTGHNAVLFAAAACYAMAGAALYGTGSVPGGEVPP